MSLKSFLTKSRTLLSGDYREVERNAIAARNERVIRKYKGKGDIYAVLRLYSDEAGLFSFFLKALGGISYCRQHGYIPVIDMQTKENIFFDAKERKRKNVWECFFEQPAGVSFADVKGKKNVIVLENPRMPEGSMLQLLQQERLRKYWHKAFVKYIHYTEPVKEEISRYEKAFAARKKWLGVLARGTDYLSVGVGHAVQPDRDTLLAKIRSVKEDYGCDGIFLATEDEDILDMIKESFGDEVMVLEQKRYRGKQEQKLGQKADYKKDAIAMNITYLAALDYLSRCSCLIAANTGGTTGVYIMSEGFEYTHCWFLGTMGSTDERTLDIDKL
ncbi:MAG: hypothetical protein K6E50_04200 [Lachnospiraceae bacterium]|nr:hypothetical protein [Lachnospiraceae bacterium]